MGSLVCQNCGSDDDFIQTHGGVADFECPACGWPNVMSEAERVVREILELKKAEVRACRDG